MGLMCAGWVELDLKDCIEERRGYRRGEEKAEEKRGEGRRREGSEVLGVACWMLRTVNIAI
jgi:hypothetical protein